MAATALRRVIDHVRLLAAAQTGRALSDAQLLARFIEQNDEAAFTVLVERHAPMVLGVCQRALRHAQDAEDACQATFLVLTRKAGSIRKTASLDCWLHGIACRVCANLKRQRARREKRERCAAAPAAAASPGDGWHEIQAVLDEELQKLPQRYRAPLLLCYWEGKTRDEAAEKLGLTVGQLHGLLERGRAQLRARLTARGVTLPAALCASFLSAGAGNAAPAPMLVISCTKAALLLAAGEPLAPGIVPDQVLTLTREVVRTMFITKLKIAGAFILCTGLLAGLIGASLPTSGLAQDQPKKAKMAEPAAPKTESDEAFIQRMSKDLRGIEPSPTEVHFFLSSRDSGKRQKLIDLFIQERQVKAKKDSAKPMQQTQPMMQPYIGMMQPMSQPFMSMMQPMSQPMAQPMMQPTGMMQAMGSMGLMQPMMQPSTKPNAKPASPDSANPMPEPKAKPAGPKSANPMAEPKAKPTGLSSYPSASANTLGPSTPLAEPNANLSGLYLYNNERTLAIKERDAWQERAAWSRRMYNLGYVSKAQADCDQSKLEAAELALKILEKKQNPNYNPYANLSPYSPYYNSFAEPKANPASPKSPAVQPKANAGVFSLQGKFLKSLAAAKDHKEVAAMAHDYLDALTKHINERPKADDVPEAMLQLELVYRSLLGKTVEANAWRARLNKEYPHSPAAQQSNSLMLLEQLKVDSAK